MKYYKPSLNVQKQHSLVHNFIFSITFPDLGHVPQKHHQVRELVETVPNGLVFIPSREKAILAATKLELVICNRWEINPEYEKVLS